MSTALNNLLFKVSLLDKMSGPAKGMMNTMDTATSRIKSGLIGIGVGGAGLASVIFSLERMVGPAKEMRTALGIVESLGVESQSLDHLRKTALAASIQYGASATQMVEDSYLLQSAIGGIEGNELSMLTKKSALFATATKATFEESNKFVGQMFNLFEDEVNLIGKSSFMDKLIGKTATAVRLFNTDGGKMSEAMKNIGKQATAMKVPLEEQLAVVGFLQNTMIEGGRSGNAYASFLSNINKAESTLGMSFTNSQNQMLPIVDIIAKIEGKFGDLSKTADQAILQKAFGKNGQKMLAAMAGSMGTFKGHLKSLNDVKGLEDINKMANAIVDPWDQASEAGRNLSIMIGDKLLVHLVPLYNGFTDIAKTLMRWSELFPNLTSYIAKGILMIAGLATGIAALSVIIGIGKFMTGGFKVAWVVLKFTMLPFTGLLSAIGLGFKVMFLQMRGGATIMAAMNFGWSVFIAKLKLSVFWSKIYAGGLWLMNKASMAAAFGMKIFNLAMTANPILLIIGGVVALGAAIIALTGNWDNVTASVSLFFEKISSLNGIKSMLPDFMLSLFSDTPTVSTPASLKQSATANVQPGGIGKQISSTLNANKSTDIGGVVIHHYGNNLDGQVFADEMAMQVG